MLTHSEMLCRIVVGAALGGVIGYERDRHGRPVGLRTHLLTAMTAATFMVVSAHFVYFQHYAPGDHVEVDGSRIAASVVSGIGFLAGGSILRTGATVQGLTTAAGLWLVTAIGLCAGAGMYLEAAAVTLMGILALTVLRRFEDKDDKVVARRVALVLADEPQALARVLASLTELGARVGSIDYDNRRDEKKRISVVLELRVPAALAATKLLEVLEANADVRRVHLQVPA